MIPSLNDLERILNSTEFYCSRQKRCSTKSGRLCTSRQYAQFKTQAEERNQYNVRIMPKNSKTIINTVNGFIRTLRNPNSRETRYRHSSRKR